MSDEILVTIISSGVTLLGIVMASRISRRQANADIGKANADTKAVYATLKNSSDGDMVWFISLFFRLMDIAYSLKRCCDNLLDENPNREIAESLKACYNDLDEVNEALHNRFSGRSRSL